MTDVEAAVAPGYTQAEYDALRRAYARGVTKVQYSTGPGQSKIVEFASGADLERRMKLVGRELGLIAAAPTYWLAVFDRGR